MAEEKEDKKAAKAAAKEAKKREKEEKKKAAEENGEEEEETVVGKLLIVGVAIIIVAIWLLILGLLIKMDVGGFGSTVLYPVLKDVPVVNKILPSTQEYAEEDSAYQFATMDEAVNRIKELEQQLADANTATETNQAHIAELEAQAAELQAYKENEAAFNEQKEKFYQEVVFSENAPDINAYKEYYESIEPENAEAIYKQVVGQLQADAEIEDYAKTYSSMEPEAAAAIFDSMTDNLKLVAKILKAMDTQSRADIMGAMNTDTAAALTKLMEP
jgi:flagellar motility protein MotE (MotC chaperone)